MRFRSSIKISALGALTLAMAFMSGLPLGAQEAADKLPAYLADASTGSVLVAKNADKPFAPASTAKLMTAAVVFAELRAGNISLATEYKVSEHAWRTGGAPSRTTTMFAALNSLVPVKDLLAGLIVQNANDAAIVLAEGLAGSEGAFADKMNKLAAELGMTASRFANPTGYDAEGSQTTARDLAILAMHVINDYPDFYLLYSQADFTWNKIFQRNRNPIIGAIRGLDGVVSGYSETDGFNAVGSMMRGERRFIAVIAGRPTDKARIDALEELFNSVEKDFEEVTLFQADEEVAEARTFGGILPRVSLVAQKPVRVLLPRGDRHEFRLRVVYRGPLVAPVKKGTEVGELRILKGEDLTYQVPLVANSDVATGDMRSRAFDTVTETLFGWW